jgi:hypothetical protein
MAAAGEHNDTRPTSGIGHDPDADAETGERPADQTSLSLRALRDLALAAALLSLFAAAEAWALTSEATLAGLLSILDGFVVGAALGALAHEWGHFLGARSAGGIAPLRPIGDFFPIFDYDYARNDARAFDRMSLGGNLAHWAVVLFLLLALPLDSSGTDALASGAFGFAVFSSAVEFPVIRRARSGMAPLEALGTIPKDFVRRYLPWAIGAALALFVLL